MYGKNNLERYNTYHIIPLMLIFFNSFLYGQDAKVDIYAKNNNHKDTIINIINMEFKINLNFNPELFNYSSENAKFTITRINDGKVIINDSLCCENIDLKYKDYNQDEILDILIYHLSDIRSNEFYYLYISDTVNKTFTKVKDFEDVSNPTLNNEGLIMSSHLSGLIYYSFYFINKKSKLEQIGKTITDDGTDKNNNYDKEYKKVLQLLSKRKIK